MICPYCLHEIAETWQPVYICTDYKGQPLDQPSTYISARFEDYTSLSVALRWMQCPNDSCRQVLVTVHRAEREAAVRRSPMIENVEEWFAELWLVGIDSHETISTYFIKQVTGGTPSASAPIYGAWAAALIS